MVFDVVWDKEEKEELEEEEKYEFCEVILCARRLWKKNRTALFYCPKTGVNRERRQLKYLPLQKENLGY